MISPVVGSVESMEKRNPASGLAGIQFAVSIIMSCLSLSKVVVIFRPMVSIWSSLSPPCSFSSWRTWNMKYPLTPLKFVVFCSGVMVWGKTASSCCFWVM